MKKTFRVSAYLVNIHSQRYRGLLHLESKIPSRTITVTEVESASLYQRQSYVFMRRYRDGISRNMFVFIKPLLEEVKT